MSIISIVNQGWSEQFQI